MAIRHLAAIAFLCVATCCGCMTPNGFRMVWFEDQVIYQPSPYPEGEWNPQGLVYEDVEFTSQDGARLHGWYCPVPQPREIVLFAHGNAGNLSHRASTARKLTERLGVSVMLFDYRGYGRSKGRPSEAGVLEDARAARTWLSQRTGVAEKDIVLLGRSLGGGVMVDLAAQDGARGLILESTFTSLPAVAASHPALAPLSLLMSNRMNSADKIPQFRGPLLMSHGDRDDLIPFKIGQKLYAKANEPKKFVTIKGAGHNWSFTEEYLQELDKFLGSLPPRQQRAEVANTESWPHLVR